MGWPSTLTMMSPGLRPALAAGESAMREAGDFNVALLAPTRESSAGFGIEHRSHGNQLALSIANDPDAQRMARAGHFFHVDVFPARVGGVADLYDAVAFLQAGFGGGAVRARCSRSQATATKESWGTGP